MKKTINKIEQENISLIENKIKELNKKVNLMYRQLGKNLYNSITDNNNDGYDSEVHKIVSKISYYIKNIKKLKQKMNIHKEGYTNKEEALPKDAILKKPETNEEGMTFLSFCSKCKVGNHPESTHCINCGNKL